MVDHCPLCRKPLLKQVIDSPCNCDFYKEEEIKTCNHYFCCECLQALQDSGQKGICPSCDFDFTEWLEEYYRMPNEDDFDEE